MKKRSTKRDEKTRLQVAHKNDRRQLASYLATQGQLLLPMMDLIEQSKMAVDELIGEVGRAAVEAILTLSAQEIAGPKQQGRRDGQGGPAGWHGSQEGKVVLSDRKLKVDRPRLRTRGAKSVEVEIPAYEAMKQDARLGERMMEILLAGVSTRKYERVIPELADTVGVSKSNVSREFVTASSKELKRLNERRFDDTDLLVIYIDGMVFGSHHVVAAVGVDTEGKKHALGLAEGASENQTVVKDLLQSLVERGVEPGRRRLFVIDGSKALRTAIDQVYGADNPVQRCRNHKINNVVDYLPKEIKPQVRAAMKAAYKLSAKKGMARLHKQADWLDVEHPSAAESLREGLEETFTVNKLGLSPDLQRCLCTTNIIESQNSMVRLPTRRVGRWRHGQMVLRWAGAAFLEAEKSFRRIMGYKHIWMLQAALRDESFEATLDNERRAS